MDDISKALKDIRESLPYIECRIDEPMKNHTSFHIGGELRAMFIPGNADELLRLCDLLRRDGTAPLIIGNGTNLLVDDRRPLDILAIKTTGIDFAEQTADDEITAGAGISLSNLAEFAYGCGLSGLECIHGIPGSLGGAITMNAGAYGREIKDIVYSTNAYNHSEGQYAITVAEHEFSYRHSRFSEVGDIIISSIIKLQKGDKEEIRAKMDDLNARRRESQPLEQPSAGSTFKRPRHGYAAKLIEQAGLKGFSIGGAMVSEKHAGFIVNTGGATFSDVMSVIDHVRETVLLRTRIELEPEIKIIRG